MATHGEIDVFDAVGAHLGSVALPDRFDALEVGDDYVLGVYLDDDDVPFIRMYEMRSVTGQSDVS